MNKSRAFKDSKRESIMLSIIVPVYNGEQTIIKLLDSICNINREDYEVICVNDGSTDKTELYIKEYSRIHKNVKLISQRNGGPSKARNTGIAVAKGEYIAFADSDDTYDTRNLEKAFEVIDENKDISLFVFDYIEKNSISMKKCGLHKNEVIDVARYLEVSYILAGDFYVHCLMNKIYKKELIDAMGGLDDNIRLGEDAVYNLKCLNKIKKIYVSSISIYNYKIYDTSLSHSSKSFLSVYSCYERIIDLLKEIKNDLNINIDTVIHNYYFGIINTYISSENIKVDEKVVLKKCLKQLRENHNKINAEKFSKFNRGIYVLIRYRFYSIVILLCDLQRLRKRRGINTYK